MLSLALGSPRVCVRRDRKHAQGKVLKARACWFSNLHLPQARAGSTYCVLLALASGSGLGHPATHPRSLRCCASRTRCWVAASRERGLRVESSSKTCFRLLWALPECASGGTGNTRRERCLRLVLVGSPTCTCRKRALARRIVPFWHLRRVQALATLPHTSAPISVVHGALAVGLPPCA